MSSRVLFQPSVSQEIRSGVQEFARLVRPTLGPLPRCVMLSQGGQSLPRPVDSAGLVARHFLDRKATRANLGLRLAAGAAARLQDSHGDGTAAAGVMLETLVTQGVRMIQAGGNPMLLRRYLEEGLSCILDQLDQMRIPLSGRQQLTRLALTISGDPLLSRYLGEIFDVIGEFGRLEIREGRSEEFEREYIDGLYWDKGMVSAHMANNAIRQEAFLENPAVFITNYYFYNASQVTPILDTAVRSGFKHLLLISTGFTEEVIALLVQAANQERVWTVAVEPPVVGDERIDFIQDLAAITGAQPLLRASDLETELVTPSTYRLNYARAENFGRARRAWVTTGSTGLSGGKGDAKYLRHYIGDLRRRLEREENEEYRKKMRARLSKLLGGSVTLWVGGSNPISLRERKASAERTAEALRSALREGTLPGGGSALLACSALLEARLPAARSMEERMAYSLLLEAVQQPVRAILENAGLHPDPILADIRLAGLDAGYDVLKRQVISMRSAGILDAAAVVKASLRTAVSAAISALTTESIVR